MIRTGWIEGTAILIAVVIVSTVTAANDWSKDRKFRQLSATAEDRKIKVVREGKSQVISGIKYYQSLIVPVFDLVVADIVLLETGDYIPADLLYRGSLGYSVASPFVSFLSFSILKAVEVFLNVEKWIQRRNCWL